MSGTHCRKSLVNIENIKIQHSPPRQARAPTFVPVQESLPASSGSYLTTPPGPFSVLYSCSRATIVICPSSSAPCSPAGQTQLTSCGGVGHPWSLFARYPISGQFEWPSSSWTLHGQGAPVSRYLGVSYTCIYVSLQRVNNLLPPPS